MTRSLRILALSALLAFVGSEVLAQQAPAPVMVPARTPVYYRAAPPMQPGIARWRYRRQVRRARRVAMTRGVVRTYPQRAMVPARVAAPAAASTPVHPSAPAEAVPPPTNPAPAEAAPPTTNPAPAEAAPPTTNPAPAETAPPTTNPPQ
jgi:hypothetical protein